MSLLTNPILAKLLAKENLEVRHGNYRTAWFDVENRVLGLPIWKDHGKDVYDLLVGHEVGHALFTPAEGWHESNEEIKGCPRGYLNVIEDVRIERKIRNTYPGLVAPMRRGYKVLLEKEFFGDIASYNMDSLKLIDKINLKSKLGPLVEVPFNLEEQQLMDRSLVAETWSEVVQIVRDILAYTKEQEEKKVELPKARAEQGEDESDDSEENNDTPSVSNTPSDEDTEEDLDPTSGNSDETSSDDTDLEEETDSSSFTENNDNNDIEQSITDEIFRSKEDELLDVDEDGYQDVFVRELSKEVRDSVTVTYSQLAEERSDHQTKNEFHNIENKYDLRNHFNQYIKGVKKSIIPAIKEFEMRKAAYQYQRASTAKTGSIDVNKIHSYKYSDDIFSKVTTLANAKNHGMFLLVDYSGSMHNSLSNVLDQVMHLVMFCKSINIPFEVYAFTTTNDGVTFKNGNNFDGLLELDDLALLQLTSSTLKKKDFETSMYNLWIRNEFYKNKPGVFYNRDLGGYVHRSDVIPRIEELGSTPLHQALIVSHYLVKDMINRNNIEKMNFVTLTDGDSNTIQVYNRRDNANKDNVVKSNIRHGYNVVVDKKIVKIRKGRGESTKALLQNMKATLGTNNIGFYIAESSRDMYYEANYKDGTFRNRNSINKEFRENRCVEFNDVNGYSTYYIIRADGSSLSTEADQGFSETNSDASKGKLTTEFKKFSKSKSTNKVLMTKMGKAVA